MPELLAQEAANGGSTFGWYVGLTIAFAIIVVVVVIVASILTLANKIGRQAAAAIQALDAGRNNTLPLWDIQKVNDNARGILESARRARRVLEGS